MVEVTKKGKEPEPIGMLWLDPNQFCIMGLNISEPPIPNDLSSYEQILSIRHIHGNIMLTIHEFPHNKIAQTKRHILLTYLIGRLAESRGHLEGDEETPNFIKHLFKYCNEVINIPEIETKSYIEFHSSS